ncbi:hypothetical protein YC2023_114468 [Brassica napus]
MANDVVKPVYGSFVPVLKGEKLTMRILVDHSIVEGFGQGGRTCITSRVYPTKAIYGATKLFLFNNAIDATVTASFKKSNFLNLCALRNNIIYCETEGVIPILLYYLYILTCRQKR